MLKGSTVLELALKHPEDPMLIASLKEEYEAETGHQVSEEFIKNFLKLQAIGVKK